MHDEVLHVLQALHVLCADYCANTNRNNLLILTRGYRMGLSYWTKIFLVVSTYPLAGFFSVLLDNYE